MVTNSTAEYREPTRKGRLIWLAFAVVCVCLLFAIYFYVDYVQGTEDWELIIQASLYMAIVNALFFLMMIFEALFIAKFTHKFMEYPPPNMLVPFRVKIKKVKKAWVIWFGAGLYVLFCVIQIYFGFAYWHITSSLNISSEPSEFQLNMAEAAVHLKQGNEKEAIGVLQSRCDLSEESALSTIGFMYHAGMEVDTDYEKALSYYVRACNADNVSACVRQADVLADLGRFSESEKLLIPLAEQHKLPEIYGALVDLYRDRRWSDASEEKAQYWLSRFD